MMCHPNRKAQNILQTYVIKTTCVFFVCVCVRIIYMQQARSERARTSPQIAFRMPHTWWSPHIYDIWFADSHSAATVHGELRWAIGHKIVKHLCARVIRARSTRYQYHWARSLPSSPHPHNTLDALANTKCGVEWAITGEHVCECTAIVCVLCWMMMHRARAIFVAYGLCLGLRDREKDSLAQLAVSRQNLAKLQQPANAWDMLYGFIDSRSKRIEEFDWNKWPRLSARLSTAISDEAALLRVSWLCQCV